MTYKITITQTTDRQASYEHEWKRVYKDVDEATSAGVQYEGGRISVHAYVTPPGEHTVYDKHTVFEQEVDELDVYAVIKAVNGETT